MCVKSKIVENIMGTSSANVMFGGNLTFDHRTQEWGIFKSRFNQFCLANEISQETDKAGTKRRAILLTSLAEETYRVVRDLAAPTDLEDKEYTALLKLLEIHFVPKKSSFAERYKFYKAEQRPGEELADWAARVRSLAQHCGFGTELQTALRDRFVLGLENVKEKEKLFAESISNLTFDRALELAASVRCARLALHGTLQEAPQPVYALRPAAPRAAAAAAHDSDSARCEVCGYKSHSKDQCRFVNFTCKNCNKRGHLKRMCKLRVRNNNFMETVDGDIVEGNVEYDLFHIKCNNGEPMRQVVTIVDQNILCEIDSGSAVSVLPDSVYQSYFKNKYELKSCQVVLNCYNGSKITPSGCLQLPVTYDNRTRSITVFVIATQTKQPVLLGRDFISVFDLQLCNVECNNIQQNDYATFLRAKYSKLFTDELGQFNKHTIQIKVKPEAQFKFFKPRPVPLALKSKVEDELKRLVDLGILEKVEHAEVATPIVPVLRPDGNVRICGDFSVTLNKMLYMDDYPLPRIEDLFSKLHGGEQFSKLDLSRAYNQLVLDESKHLTCINTHKGLYRYNRLVFGLRNAPFIFQKTMENLLGDIEGICIFLDDILVTGENRKIHSERLELVLKRLEDAGLRLRPDKCELFRDSVEYLGFIIDKNGLHKSDKKVDAIINCKCPSNVSELKSFLGMVNYYRCFVPNTSSVLNPLHLLLQKGVKWQWGEEQDKAFCKIKSELASDRVLAHYNPEYETIVTSDAGPAGLGAVLSQRQPDGSERVIAYASRSLGKAECNYAQIQKEATSIIFAIKKFHHYLYGRPVPFTLRTDHKPLLSIFGSKKGVPELAANRLQRYALFLTAYNFKIEYVKSENNVADFLSRAISNYSEFSTNADDNTLYINFITDAMLKPVTMRDIQTETAKDTELSKVICCLKNGWPTKCRDQTLKPYFLCRLQLSLENGCILRGHKLVIPIKFREQLLDELHSSHFGVVKTKTEARSRFWWPDVDRHIEEKIGSCSACAALRAAPPRAPLAPWPYPPKPWQRMHLDMFTLYNKQFLVAIDAHTKWVECYVMEKTDSKSVLDKLSDIFCRYGLVRTLVTDNGSNFVSNEFEEFCNSNGINHLTSAPYHPASNGQAENTVKSVKKALKIILKPTDNQNLTQKIINKYLFDYRNSVHCTTGFSPAQLMFGRPLRGRFDLLRDNTGEPSTMSLSTQAKQNVSCQQILQSKQYGGRRTIHLNVGDAVLVKHFYNNGNKSVWKNGTIKSKIGTTVYMVHIHDLDISVKKHVDQLLMYKGSPPKANCSYDDSLTYYDCNLPSTDSDKELVSPTASSCTERVSVAEGEGNVQVDHETLDDEPFEDCSSDNDDVVCEGEPEPEQVTVGNNYPVRSTRNVNPRYKF